MISPAILFNLITGAIAAFQYFTQAYVVSEGTVGRGAARSAASQNSLLFYGLNLYNNAFRYFKLGYASALAWVLLLIILWHDPRCCCGSRGGGSTTRGALRSGGPDRPRDRAQRAPAVGSSAGRVRGPRRSLRALPDAVHLDGGHVAQDGAAGGGRAARLDPVTGRVPELSRRPGQDRLPDRAPQHAHLRHPFGGPDRRLFQHGRLRLLPRQVARPRRGVRDRAGDDDAAAAR